MSGIFGIFKRPAIQPVAQVPKRVCKVGAFLGDGVPTSGQMHDFQKMTGKYPSIVMWYHAFVTGFEFPKEACDIVSKFGGLPFIKLEPWSWKGITDNSFSLARIAEGEFDSGLCDFAAGARNWGKEVAIAFGHEMNIPDIYPWGGDHDAFTRAWGHIHLLFDDMEATKVKWVFNPNHYPPTSIREYYPGSRLVDIFAIDGFNWGNTQEWSHWASFSEIFGEAYKEVTDLSNKPVWIGEMACAEQGGSKPGWIKESLAQIKAGYPRLEAFTWFDLKKETDWRINSTKASAQAFRRAISDPCFIGGKMSLLE